MNQAEVVRQRPALENIPTFVKHDDLVEALRPLMVLLGLAENAQDLYADPGLQVVNGRVKFMVPVVEGTEGAVLHGDEPYAEWALPIEVWTEAML